MQALTLLPEDVTRYTLAVQVYVAVDPEPVLLEDMEIWLILATGRGAGEGLGEGDGEGLGEGLGDGEGLGEGLGDGDGDGTATGKITVRLYWPREP